MVYYEKILSINNKKYDLSTSIHDKMTFSNSHDNDENMRCSLSNQDTFNMQPYRSWKIQY